jgi:hypothetical protein
MIIAIDGPAASGKGTLGKRLAHHYGYRHLDTGVIYRAVAFALLEAGSDLGNEALAVAAAMELDPEKFGNPVLKTRRWATPLQLSLPSPRFGKYWSISSVSLPPTRRARCWMAAILEP